MKKLRTYRLGKRRAPELRLTLGPVAPEMVGGGTFAELYTTPWAFAVIDDELLMFRHLGSWEQVSSEPWPATRRHMAAAWDQAARRVIAWEEAQTINLEAYDLQTAQIQRYGPFPGVDPCLFNDALGSQSADGADIKLFYLSADRERLLTRYQGDLYGVERELQLLGTQHHLNQVASAAQRLVFGLADADGAAAAPLVSELYPLFQASRVALGADFSLSIAETTLKEAAADAISLGVDFGLTIRSTLAQFAESDAISLGVGFGLSIHSNVETHVSDGGDDAITLGADFGLTQRVTTQRYSEADAITLGVDFGLTIRETS